MTFPAAGAKSWETVLRALTTMLLLHAYLDAQQPGADNGSNGRLSAFASFRTRLEGWDWFDNTPGGTYAYSGSTVRAGLRGDQHRYDWQVEFAGPVLLGLPTDAVETAPQGQLGFGGTYFQANSGTRSTGLSFLKQAYIRFHGQQGAGQQSLAIGRMEFAEGTEAIGTADSTVAALKRDRIQQRLVGTFGFTHGGRSFDGVHYTLDRPGTNITVFAARPTRGVFQVDGWGQLNISVFYGGFTRQIRKPRGGAEWRVFGIGYNDYRHAVLKTDNRPIAARQNDLGRIDLFTVGGHYLEAVDSEAGTIDLLLWGAWQGGSWGALAQRSGAAAVEAGFQPSGWRSVRPWFRAGFNFASGDGNPNDGIHGTFFQLLPTPRGYARFPFFNLMNTMDTFGEAILRPARAVTIRVDVHALRLASSTDLWYVGGGAFQPWTFGYAGRPSGGRSALATLGDASLDYNINSRTSAGFYWGHAAGKDVVSRIYPKGGRANFGLIEFNYRF